MFHIYSNKLVACADRLLSLRWEVGSWFVIVRKCISRVYLLSNLCLLLKSTDITLRLFHGNVCDLTMFHLSQGVQALCSLAESLVHFKRCHFTAAGLFIINVLLPFACTGLVKKCNHYHRPLLTQLPFIKHWMIKDDLPLMKLLTCNGHKCRPTIEGWSVW